MDDTTKPRFHPERVRLPLLSEILRLAVVACAAFYHSPVNAYERPHRDQYPRDTVHNYLQELLGYLLNPECILIVLDDEYEKSEDTKLYPALKGEYGGYAWSQKDGRLIVGFACLKLKHGSDRVGKFQPEDDPSDVPDGSEDRKRDQSREGVAKFASIIGPPMERHTGGQFCVDMIAVHPTYWRRGHGTSFLMWAARLADEDQISLGVGSVPMGVQISRNVGFKEQEVVEVEGYSEHPESLEIWIGIRECGPLPSIPKADPQSGWSWPWWLTGFGSIFWRRSNSSITGS